MFREKFKWFGKCALVGLLFALNPLNPAFAEGIEETQIEEAGVEKGEAEVEYDGLYTSDNGEGNYFQSHSIDGSLGITDFLKLGLQFTFSETENGPNFDFSGVEGYFVLELFDPEEKNIGFSIYGGLEKEVLGEDEKSFQLGILTETTIQRILFRGNLFYTAPIDAEADEDGNGVNYAYQIKYNVNDNFGIGVEGYGTHFDFDDPGEDDINQHVIGPVLYYSREREEERGGSLKDDDGDDDDGDDNDDDGPEFSATLGVLFGTNDESPDYIIKWGLGVEF